LDLLLQKNIDLMMAIRLTTMAILLTTRRSRHKKDLSLLLSYYQSRRVHRAEQEPASSFPDWFQETTLQPRLQKRCTSDIFFLDSSNAREL
jgi:hypothetical protein